MNLKAQRAAALNAAQAIIQHAKAAARDLTATEVDRLKTYQEQIEQLDGKIKAADEGDALMARLGALPGGSPVDPEQMHTAKAGLIEAVKQRSSRQVSVSRKALSTVGLGLPPTGNGTVGAPAGTAATALRDLFLIQTTESPVIRYFEVGAATGGPNIVAEGALKPEMTATVTPRDVPMVKIAGRLVLTTEYHDDAPSIVQELMNQRC